MQLEEDEFSDDDIVMTLTEALDSEIEINAYTMKIEIKEEE